MSRTTYNIHGLKVVHETSIVGPRTDPYQKDEYRFTRLGVEVTLTVCALAGVSIEARAIESGPDRAEGSEHRIFDLAKAIAGLDILSGIEEAQGNCPQCGSEMVVEQYGYPGETFHECEVCGHMFSYKFNETAVE